MKDFKKINVIDALSSNGVEIEFLDFLFAKDVGKELEYGNTVTVSPLASKSGIYANGFDAKTGKSIKVKLTPNQALLISEKILNEKWNMFTEFDREKRQGYSASVYGQPDAEFRYPLFVFTVTYKCDVNSSYWVISLEKGYKETFVNEKNVRKFVENSYVKEENINMIVSTNRISEFALKMRSAIENAEAYSRNSYYMSRHKVEESFRNSN